MAHNNWFKFKQFTVWQNHAAMRVGTDGVLLGAWAEVDTSSHVLDIGTGTGVVALIVAQRSNAQIDAIDIDEGAITDATQNFENSPWKDRLNVQHTPLQLFTLTCTKKYDAIICNPPFFNNSEKSKISSRKTARHTDSLSFDELAKNASTLLAPNGTFFVILPATEETTFRNTAASYQLFASNVTRVHPKPSKPAVRVLMAFKFNATFNLESELTLETETHHHYSPEFQEMVKDFYLKC